MDSKVQEVMQGMSREISIPMQEFQGKVHGSMEGIMENCFKNSGSNPDRFATCFQESKQRLEKESQKFSFKVLFMSRLAQQCINNGNSVDRCKSEVVQKVLESIKSSEKVFQNI